MNQTEGKSKDRKSKIKGHIKELSRLLGMTPSDDNIKIQEPTTQNEMELSDWLDDTRGEFLRLSLLISKELDISIAETNLISENLKDKWKGKID